MAEVLLQEPEAPEKAMEVIMPESRPESREIAEAGRATVKVRRSQLRLRKRLSGTYTEKRVNSEMVLVFTDKGGK